MGHISRAYSGGVALAALTGITFAATPAAAEVDCFPRAAPALYSSAAHPRALPASAPAGGTVWRAAPAVHPHHHHAAASRTSGGHGVGPHRLRVSHPRTPIHHPRSQVAQLAAPPALAASGADTGAVAGLPGLAHAATRPEACAPAGPTAAIGPIIAAAPRSAGIVGWVGPYLPGAANTGTPTDTSGVTGTDTGPGFPPGDTFTDQPSEPVVVGTLPGGGPGGVPGGGPGSAVPEPAGWALMLAGLFGMGGALRISRRARRKRSVSL